MTQMFSAWGFNYFAKGHGWRSLCWLDAYMGRKKMRNRFAEEAYMLTPTHHACIPKQFTLLHVAQDYLPIKVTRTVFRERQAL